MRNDEVAGRRSLGKKAVLDCRLNCLEHPLSAAGTNLPGAVVDRTWDEGDVADLERRDGRWPGACRGSVTPTEATEAAAGRLPSAPRRSGIDGPTGVALTSQLGAS